MSSLAAIAVGLALVAALFVGTIFVVFLLGVGLCLLPIVVMITNVADWYHEWRWRRAQVTRAPAAYGRVRHRPPWPLHARASRG